MSVNERIKQVRQGNNLTLEKFGERIGIKKGSLSQIETGKSNPSDQTIRSISREFGVREEWLRTGEGEQSAPAPAMDLDQYARASGISPAEEELIRAWLAFPAEKRREVVDHMRGYLSGAVSASPAEPEEPKDWNHMTREEKIAEFTRQLDEEEKNRRQEAESAGGPSADLLSG